MKKLIITLATLSFLTFPSLQGQNTLQALFYHAGFYSPQEGPYVETYLKVFGQSAKFVKNQSGKFQASLKVTIMFKQDEKIVEWRNYNLLSEEVADTSDIQQNFIDQQRISLPSGVYQMELILNDNNRKIEPLEHAQMISMEYDNSKLRFSDIQFIESYSPTEESNVLSKSGFDLVPFVGDFFDENVDKLTFYTELYNLDKQIGDQEDFLFRYYLESFETTVSLSEYNKFQRQKAGKVNVLMASVPIGNLPSGNFNLVVEAVDRTNQELLVNKIFFMKSNPTIQLNYDDIEAVDITSTFAEKISNSDSLKFYVASLYPMANSMEKQFIKNVVNADDIEKMQKFLYNFWTNINPDYPEIEWNRYKLEVARVEESFGTKIKHGFETDQGRVWLKYGPPDNAEFSDHEPTAYPYVIWQYYRLDRQNNRRFIFYNPALVGTEYYLLHSDAQGEIYNPEWQIDLHGRTAGSGGSSAWGSRAGSKIRK
jgi:GWxTD domain-containing protein